MEHALAVLDCTGTKRAVLERLERRIGEGERKGDEDTEEDYLPSPWSCLARSVYPPLINHPCLLDPNFDFELNKRPIGDDDDDIVDPPTRLDAFIDAEQGEILESMDAHNAKRHERMLWRLVGKGDEIEESDGALDEEEEEEEEDMNDYTPELPRMAPALRKWGAPKSNWVLRLRRAGGTMKSKPFVNTSDEESDSE